MPDQRTPSPDEDDERLDEIYGDLTPAEREEIRWREALLRNLVRTRWKKIYRERLQDALRPGDDFAPEVAESLSDLHYLQRAAFRTGFTVGFLEIIEALTRRLDEHGTDDFDPEWHEDDVADWLRDHVFAQLRRDETFDLDSALERLLRDDEEGDD